jgi:hypothetical protein
MPPPRLDAVGSAIFHASQMILYTLMPLAITTLVLGLDPVAAGIGGLLAVFNSVFHFASFVSLIGPGPTLPLGTSHLSASDQRLIHRPKRLE